MTIDTAYVQTSFQFEDVEVRRFPFAVPVSVGTRIVLDGDVNDERDLRAIDVRLHIGAEPVLVVEIGEQRGPGPTPV
jgi:hypothetical protein